MNIETQNRNDVIKPVRQRRNERQDSYFLEKNRKIRHLSVDDVISIGGIIQSEIRRTLHPSPLPATTSARNWKSVIIHYIGLLISKPLQMPFFSYNLQQESKDVTSLPHHIPENNNEKLIPTGIKEHPEYVRENNIQTQVIHKREKRNTNNIKKTEELIQAEEKDTKYSLIVDNIKYKIFGHVDTLPPKDKELIKILKDEIKSYAGLQEKNSRKGIESLKNQARILEKLRADASPAVQDNISEIITSLHNEYKSLKVEIDKKIHVVWIAGAPPETITKYAKAYKAAYPDFSFNLWIDPNAFAAYEFNSQLKNVALEHAKSEVINSLTIEEFNILKNKEQPDDVFQAKLKTLFETNLLKSVLQIQDAVMNYAYTRGILNFSDQDRISFLKEILHYDNKKIDKFKEIIHKNKIKTYSLNDDLSNIFGQGNFHIHDATMLPDMKKVQYKQRYQQELILRGNYASATDQLRVYILKEYGGIYTDYDVTPAYGKNIYKIIQEHSINYDFLEKEHHRRALNDEILSVISKEPSTGIKNKLPEQDRKRLSVIVDKIKKLDPKDIFSPIDTMIIRDSMVMSKRYQYWGKEKGWNIRANNNFLATHKGSKVTDFVINRQEIAYKRLLEVREKLRDTGNIAQQHSDNINSLDYHRGDKKTEANLVVSGVKHASKKEKNKEVLKDLKKDLATYGALLDNNVNGLKPKDIRATEDFLRGYSSGSAERIVDGFHSDMNIKKLVKLMKKNINSLNNEQKGAMAYEIEKRALLATFHSNVEEYHKLFNKVVSKGSTDKYAVESLIPQLFFLNLSGDGYGGRCDPLSILVLTSKHLENQSSQKQTKLFLENLYSTAAVLSEPSLYSEVEIANANKLLTSLAKLHAKNPLSSTLTQIWKEKIVHQTVEQVIDLIISPKATGNPVLLKLEAPGHAMAAWAIGNDNERKYGFYDANGGVVEFSDKEKFKEYMTELFSPSGLNKAEKYHLKKLPPHNSPVFDQIVLLDGEKLSQYKTNYNDDVIKNILDIKIFDSTSKKESVIQSIKKDFIPKKHYSENSLFSNYRMDSIIPKKYSTLFISGPDAIMMAMKDYYNSLGELGECRIDREARNFKGLAEDSFVGNLKVIEGAKGVHYDWVNANSVCVNDVTPDDASTWVAKLEKIEDIFSNVETLKKNSGLNITPTEINISKLTVGWPSEIKKAIKEKWPEMEADYNRIISGSTIDLEEISQIDQKISKYLISQTNSLVKWVGISLAEQLAVKIKHLTLPIENKIHYLMSDIHKQFKDNVQSINSLLASDSNTVVYIWNDDNINKSLMLRELWIIESRRQSIYKLLNGQHDKTKRRLLLEYLRLKEKEQLGIIDKNRQERLLIISTNLSEDDFLKAKLIDIENKALFSSLKKISDKSGNPINIYDIKDVDTLTKNLNGLYKKKHINMLWDKYISKNTEKIKELYSALKESKFSDRVKVKEINVEFNDNSLIKNIIHDGYDFEDIERIVKYSLISKESGVVIQNAAVSAPSKELVDIVSKYASTFGVDTTTILDKLYNKLFGIEEIVRDSSKQSKIHHEIIAGVLSDIDTKNINRYFVSVMNQNVSGMGVKFSNTGNALSDDVIMSGIKEIQDSNKDIIFENIKNYFSALYATGTIIKNKGNINANLIKYIFKQKSIDFMLSDDANITNFLSKSKQYEHISLSALSEGLTGNRSFIDCISSIVNNKLPSVSEILLKEKEYRLPSIYSIIDSPLVDPVTWESIGYTGSDSYIKSPISSPTLHDISIRAKYRALEWRNFYGHNARLWHDAVIKYSGSEPRYHPQMLLSPNEGRCIGLSELYILADTKEKYNTLQENLDLISSLYQQDISDNAHLSESDHRLLKNTVSQIEYYQQHGNNKLLQSGELERIRLTDFNTASVVHYLKDKKINNILITTEYHSFVVSVFDDVVRVTDPNFGYADFSSLEQSLAFIENSVSISPDIKEIYTGKKGDVTIDMFIMNDNQWGKIIDHDACQLTSVKHLSSVEKLRKLNMDIQLGDVVFKIIDLYNYGIFFNGKRIDEKFSISKLSFNELYRMTINLDILKKYIDTNYITAKEHEKVNLLINEINKVSEKNKILVKDVFLTDNVGTGLLSKLQIQEESVSGILSAIHQRISAKLRDINIHKYKINSVNHNSKGDSVKLSLYDLDKHKNINFNIDTSDLNITLRQGLDSLTEAIDEMNIDGIMAIVGIIQYIKITSYGSYISAIDHADFMSDIKTVVEKVVGTSLIFMGVEKFGTSISQIRLETMAAIKLSQVATKIGGVQGRILSKIANVIKFPVIDTALNLWSLGESIHRYTSEKTGSLDKMLAEIDVAFASTYTALTLSSFAFPPIALATLPLIFLQQDIKTFKAHLHMENERRDAWKKVEHYLDTAARRNVVKVDTSRGVIDLSAIDIIGNLKLDLSTENVKLSGDLSYNRGKNIGNDPKLSDMEVRKRSKYAVACVNDDDLHVPSFDGGNRGERCRELSLSESRLVRGFANRRWPSHVPTIKKGNYDTVILGYSSKIVANTEVIRMAWDDFQEVARENYPLVEIMNKNTEIVTGNKNIKIIIPALDNNIFSAKNSEDLYKLSTHWFTVKGGEKGIAVFPNGVGNFNIIGVSGAKNILSFSQFSENFDVVVDLNRNSSQTVAVYNGGRDNIHTPDIKMVLIQKNINTIIGSNYGSNTFIGNDSDNQFILGRSGATIYPRKGTNVITIPNNINIFFAAKVFLDVSSFAQYIQLDFPVNDIRNIERHSNHITLSFNGNYYASARYIEFHCDNNHAINDYSGSIIIYTIDGMELELSTKIDEIIISSKLDVLKFEKHHQGIGVLDPSMILENNNLSFFGKFISELDFYNYKVISSQNTYIYKVIIPGAHFYISTNKTSYIWGERNCHYYINGDKQPPHFIYLNNDNKNPETINLSGFTDTSEEIRFYASTIKNKCILKIVWSYGSCELTLRPKSSILSDLSASETVIYLNENNLLLLKEVFELSKKTNGDTLIYNTLWQYE
ncbi:TcdA/TcdB catalytic glycosyltransferase domain-containing protein [Escherichia coli]|uniref:TcdA/TcdB catalytic glycosyltransferase domain-containing protein n=1 Tax=Escherichia coli TaxID=562 RepID=UPI0006A061FC|nr:TcdA/TcdB catalytic glycosyltransferase domain-containing protein [Escherichia coli]CTU33846.1 Efa1/LifA-like protein [Escherichia coli]CTU94158.1 Efa1/LifA-like protein [Escherichia coli]CTV56407.1 Efa1/LifA-like protein [Escherichia coli]CTX07295.1 Efa1/LifA-like protein [Escherichia coli]CTX33120.1 Efa1/LifA-like protein [Escherichia coli]